MFNPGTPRVFTAMFADDGFRSKEATLWFSLPAAPLSSSALSGYLIKRRVRDFQSGQAPLFGSSKRLSLPAKSLGW
jgi:hypothetical protein